MLLENRFQVSQPMTVKNVLLKKPDSSFNGCNNSHKIQIKNKIDSFDENIEMKKYFVLGFIDETICTKILFCSAKISSIEMTLRDFLKYQIKIIDF
jgi:hypothetical protein